MGHGIGDYPGRPRPMPRPIANARGRALILRMRKSPFTSHAHKPYNRAILHAYTATTSTKESQHSNLTSLASQTLTLLSAYNFSSLRINVGLS